MTPFRKLTVYNRTHAKDKPNSPLPQACFARDNTSVRGGLGMPASPQRRGFLAYTRVAIHHAAHVPRARAAHDCAGSAVRAAGAALL